MKKIIVILIIFSVVCLLSSCAETKEVEVKKTNSELFTELTPSFSGEGVTLELVGDSVVEKRLAALNATMVKKSMTANLKAELARAKRNVSLLPASTGTIGENGLVQVVNLFDRAMYKFCGENFIIETQNEVIAYDRFGSCSQEIGGIKITAYSFNDRKNVPVMAIFKWGGYDDDKYGELVKASLLKKLLLFNECFEEMVVPEMHVLSNETYIDRKAQAPGIVQKRNTDTLFRTACSVELKSRTEIMGYKVETEAGCHIGFRVTRE